jgi:hypothetical protein
VVGPLELRRQLAEIGTQLAEAYAGVETGPPPVAGARSGG